MVNVIDSDVLIRAFFNKHQRRKNLKYSELKDIRYNAEPNINAYIDVTYSSLRKAQMMHMGVIKMDNTKVTLLDNAIRKVEDFEKPTVALIEKYL